jgi:tRNA modification GTPase
VSPYEIDTIVAPATAAGRGALSMIRIDGPRAADLLTTLTRRPLPPERLATHLRLFDSEGEIDDAMAVSYLAPRSFTGNDLVELTVHGSPAVVERLLRAVCAAGARLAQPGEFTERAVLNGKLDLVQAEAIGQLIDSRTALQAKVSLANLEGALSRAAMGVRETLLTVLSRLEAALDFAEEGYEFIGRQDALDRVETAKATVAGLLATFDRGSAARKGLSLVLLGLPNAGKSTLLNAICGSDRAIVTAVAGTTRDLLRETVEIGGLPVTVTDTAGLRETEEEVEAIGVGRARQAARSADLVLYLVDSSRGWSSADEAETKEYEASVVFTKADLADPPVGSMGVSASTPGGIAPLLRWLDERVRERFVPAEGTAVVVTERQREALRDCAASLAAAAEGLSLGDQEEMIITDLRRAADALGVLVGAISREDVFAEIFSKFCIGK